MYEHNASNSARFVLGTVGENPLICVGMNPSTAAPGDPDLTVSKVMGFATRNGFDSWVVLNLYPQRSTDPKGMHLAHDGELKTENERRILKLIGGRRVTLLATWGELIKIRPYLPQMLAGIVSTADVSGCDWVSIGDTPKSGHPRHPSRASYAWQLQSFDVKAYLRGLETPAPRASTEDRPTCGLTPGSHRGGSDQSIDRLPRNRLMVENGCGSSPGAGQDPRRLGCAI